jgi:hypothetical protein
MKYFAVLLIALLMPHGLPAAKLLNGNLDNWEVIGDGIWTVLRDGVLVGQRDLKKAAHQSWLYTKKNDYGEFDLHLEWWTRADGNSGVSIRDTSRANARLARLGKPRARPHRVRDPDRLRLLRQVSGRGVTCSTQPSRATKWITTGMPSTSSPRRHDS